MLYRRGRVWWVRWRFAGQRLYRSTGETDRRRAARRAREIQVEVERLAGPRGRAPGLSLDLLEALDTRRVQDDGCRPGRERDIRGLWAPLVRHLGERRDATRLTVADVAAYEGDRRRDGARGQTIRREVQALVRGLRLAKRDHLISALPFDPDDLPTIRSDPRDVRQASKAWTAAEIAAVLEHLSPRAVSAGHRDALRLIQLTGLRLWELWRLRPEWVHGSTLEIPEASAKTRTAGAIPLTREALEIIRRHPRGFPPHRPNHALALASARAGMPSTLTPRDLRAWCLSQAARHDVVAAQRIGRHRNVATTSRYLHVGEERLVAAARAVARAAQQGTTRGDSR